MIPFICTAAQVHSETYLERVRDWYSYHESLKDIADFYCYVDGQIEVPNDLRGHIEFRFLPFLGRPSTTSTCFPGFRQIYNQILEDHQNGFCLVENDARIINFDKFRSVIGNGLNYSSIDPKYQFLESSFQIVQDAWIITDLKNGLKDQVYSCVPFERSIDIVTWYVPFRSVRAEGDPIRTEEYDVVCQVYG